MTGLILYSSEYCQYCRLLKTYLEKHAIQYENRDVGADHSAAEKMIALTGQYGVPVLVKDEDFVVGYDIQAVNKLLGIESEAGDSFDLVVIGGGPAGLTATLYGTRKGLKTLLLTPDIGGQATESWSVENYMGFRPVSGRELIEKFEEQVREASPAIELDTAAEILEEDGNFVVLSAGGRRFEAKAVIAASGAQPNWMGLKDEQRFIGRGISVCSTCDGPLFRDKTVAIVGGGNSALTAVLEMSRIAEKVYLIVRSKIRADSLYTEQYEELSNVETLLNYEVTAVRGDSFLRKVAVTERSTGEERTLEVDGLFLEIGRKPNIAYLGSLVEINDKKEIVIDINAVTSNPGIFAAGDVTSVAGKQIIIAAGEGAKAALSAYDYIISKQ